MHGVKGRFTLWPKVERPSIFINRIARNQEFGFLTFLIYYFLKKAMYQIMVERLSVFFS